MSIICDLVHKNTYDIQCEIHGIQEVSGVFLFGVCGFSENGAISARTIGHMRSGVLK
jgi:hypothetical protein